MRDPADFDAFYTATARRVVGHVSAMTGDRAEAEDAVAEAYARAWERWGKVSRYEDPEGWVRSVAWRISVSSWRKSVSRGAAHRRHGPPGDAPGLSPDSVAIIAALRQIPASQRHAVVLYHIVGLTVEEIARAANTTPGAIRVRLSRGRAALIPYLSDDLPGAGAGGRRCPAMRDNPQTRLRQAARECGAAAALPPPHAVRARGYQRRRRRAFGSGLLVLTLLAGSGTAYLTVARQQLAAPPLTRSTRAQSMLPAGKVGPRSAVPWSQVGPGWALAGYTQGQPYAGRVSPRKPTILYLVDPLGGRYQMYRWPASQPGGWGLVDWSGDGTRALFVSVADGRRVVHQLVLATGAVRSFTLPAGVYPIGYTRPDGTSLLAVSGNTLKGHGVLQRFGLTGALQATLATGTSAVASSSSNGATLAVGTPTGIKLVSVAGGRARRVTIPGVNTRIGCHPVRWWDASTVLVGCQSSGYALSSQLWLVPANGGSASALTPVPGDRHGYFLAWQLRSGLYLLGMAGDGCGTVIVKRAADGSATPVKGQGSGAMDVLAVAGGRMLVKWEHNCSAGWSLTWFNPATGAAAMLLPAPADGLGVTDAIPYGGQHG